MNIEYRKNIGRRILYWKKKKNCYSTVFLIFQYSLKRKREGVSLSCYTAYLPFPAVAMFPRITAEEEPDVSSPETLFSPFLSLPVSLALPLSLRNIGKSVPARFPFNRHFFPLVKARAVFEPCVLASGHDWRKSERNSDDSFRLLSRAMYTCHCGQKSIVLQVYTHTDTRACITYKMLAVRRKKISTTVDGYNVDANVVVIMVASHATYGKSIVWLVLFYGSISLSSFVPFPKPFYHVPMTRASE